MRGWSAVVAALLGALALAGAPRAAAQGLTVEVEGVSNGRGVVGVLVFRSAAGWPEDNAAAYRAVAVPARAGTVAVSVPGLPPGEYAVVVLHDENENRKLDRNWLGEPKEQWGMSNNPPARFSAPSFRQASFPFRGSGEIRVRLR